MSSGRRALMRSHVLLLVCSCGDYRVDENVAGEDVFDELVLDDRTPMVDFEIHACSTEPHLIVSVVGEVDMPPGAIVGVTMKHGERTATGFAEANHDLVGARMIEVSCNVPIDVTLERLDGGLEGPVITTVRVTGNAEGADGSTILEVIP